MSLVLDASALVYASISDDEEASTLRQRLRGETIHAPHLIDAELGNVLRRHVLREDMKVDHAAKVLREAPPLVDHRYSHTGAIATAAWKLRENVTFYDAIYVALAAALAVPLMTADGPLTRAPKLPCTIETPWSE